MMVVMMMMMMMMMSLAYISTKAIDNRKSVFTVERPTLNLPHPRYLAMPNFVAGSKCE